MNKPTRLRCWAAAGVLLMMSLSSCEYFDRADETQTQPKQSTDMLAQPIVVDARRSLVVTEQSVLSRFSLERVMDQLVSQSGVAGMTSLQLFNQWWDTQNPGPGLGFGPHCDDELSDAGEPELNTYPYSCRPTPSEGAQATTNPFAANPDGGINEDAYIPIGLFNRFDLAPADGSHCGEYRIVYAKNSGIGANSLRNLVIFEAVLPNPLLVQGLQGCKHVARFWAELSEENDINVRANELEDFYFNGLPPFAPVIHVNHLGATPPTGQVRTNQFVIAPGNVWSLREFKLTRTCTGGTCTALTFVPVTNKTNPFGPLYSEFSTHPRKAAFEAFFPTQVADLAANSLTEFSYSVPDTFNTGQSQASGSSENNYQLQFATDGGTLRPAVEAALADAGSTLTADDIVLRAQALSCAGCHRLNNNRALGGGLIWPPSLGFTHISERVTENTDAGVRFQISPALEDVFLPHRKLVLEDFVNKDKVKKTKNPQDPIGGRFPH